MICQRDRTKQTLSGFKILTGFHVLCFICLSGFTQNADWSLSVRNVKQAEANIQVLLQAQVAAPQAFQLQIQVWDETNMRILHKRQQYISLQSDSLLVFPFQLSAGKHRVDAQIEGEGRNAHWLLQEPLEVRKQIPNNLSASDILLFDAKQAPLVESELDINTKSILFRLELYDVGNTPLTARAILYRKRAVSPSDDASTYTSLQQISKLLQPRSQQLRFEAQFDLQEAEEGEYLLEVLMYENERLLLERNAHFEIAWKDKARILDELDSSIRMLRHIASNSERDGLLKIPDPNEKRQAFLRFWRNRYGASAESQMIGYFKKVYEAERRFAEQVPGWQSERGATFIQYGEPDNIQSFERKGQKYERWTYQHWNKTFVFRLQNGQYVLQRF